MSQSPGPMDILKWLDKSNCRKCGKPTCLAFAAAVVTGQKRLDECPKLDDEVVRRFGGEVARAPALDQDPEATLEMLRKRIATVDPAASAERLGATFARGKLTIKCLGRDFSIDVDGNITSSLHMHNWLAMPLAHYLTDCAGVAPSGHWAAMVDLAGGQPQYPLFAQRCEKPCKALADADTQLFLDVLGLFGRPAANEGASYVSYVLRPLPRVPMLIRYWKPEDGLESNLNILFDVTAPENLNVDMIYTLATGVVMMFEKIAIRHGWRGPGGDREVDG